MEIELTPKEMVQLYGFLEGVLTVVHANPDLDLDDKENTTAALESIMGKVAAELENT